MLTAIPLILLLSLAAGQGPASERKPPRPPAADADVAGMLDAYAVVQAGRALRLTDAQSGEFTARMRRLQETRRRHQQVRNRLVQQLRRLVGPQAPADPDQRAVQDALQALRDHDDRAIVEMRQVYGALDEVLDVRQQARFRVFEQALERRKLDLLVRARQRAADRRR